MNAVARDPGTGHRMRVYFDALQSAICCRFDNEPAELVPPEILAFNRSGDWMAMELLRRRLNVEAWSEEEELTLS